MVAFDSSAICWFGKRYRSILKKCIVKTVTNQSSWIRIFFCRHFGTRSNLSMLKNQLNHFKNVLIFLTTCAIFKVPRLWRMAKVVFKNVEIADPFHLKLILDPVLCKNVYKMFNNTNPMCIGPDRAATIGGTLVIHLDDGRPEGLKRGWGLALVRPPAQQPLGRKARERKRRARERKSERTAWRLSEGRLAIWAMRRRSKETPLLPLLDFS